MVHSDVVVVGGGLAGLAAATLCARRGRSVTLVERASHLGGRASTFVGDGFALNQGPHALYREGAAYRVLRALDVPIRGGAPALRGARVEGDDGDHPLPVGAFSLAGTSALSPGAKLAFARFLAGLRGAPKTPLDRVPVARWLDETLGPADAQRSARRMVETLVRLSTYAAAADLQCAAAARAQLARSLGGVLYLHHGWQTLVDALDARARAAGVVTRTGASVCAIETRGDGRAVLLVDGEVLSAQHVIVATGPAQARSLLPESTRLSQAVERAIPVRAACLDVALRRLPRRDRPFVLGLDAPTYLSVHSEVASLAPEGGAVIHVAKYLRHDDAPHRADRAELEAMLDRHQPGWRAEVAHVRWLPNITVNHALCRADDGGLSGRCPVTLDDAPAVSLAGDWVGDEGLLADASLASAARAAAAALDAARPGDGAARRSA